MIDSLNNNNGTALSSTSLIEVVSADAPFLALGFLSLALCTFYAVMSRSHRAATYLQAAAVTAALAVFFDFTGMFFDLSSDTIAVNSFTTISSPSLRALVTASLSLKQVMLSISLPFRLLYFDLALRHHLTDGLDTLPTPNPREKRVAKAFCDTVVYDQNERAGLWSFPALSKGTSGEDSLGLLAKMLLYAVILVIFGLELGWRLGFLLNDGVRTPFDAVNRASFALQLVLLLIFFSCPIRFILLTSPSGRGYILKMYGGILGGLILGLVVVLGSLARIGFSEGVTGRMFQGVQMYVLMLSQLIVDFRDLTPRKGSRLSQRFTLVNQGPRQSSSEGLRTPNASTFRVAPPTVSTPSPPNLLAERKVSFHPWSTGSMLDPPASRPTMNRRGSSMSSRVRSWVMVGRGRGTTFFDAEEARGLRSAKSGNDTLSPAMSPYSAYDTPVQVQPQASISRHSANSGSGGSGLPASPSPARKPNQSVVRKTSRSRRVSSLVGIRRTISSPGARMLVLGSEYDPDLDEVTRKSRINRGGRTDSMPSDITSDQRYSAMSLSTIQDLGFPRPPSRHVHTNGPGYGNGGFPSTVEVAEGNGDIDDLPLPVMPVARDEMRGRFRHGSDATHVDVTSFIEGRDRASDSIESRLVSLSSPQTAQVPGRTSHRRDVTSFIEVDRLSRVSEYSQGRPQTRLSIPTRSQYQRFSTLNTRSELHVGDRGGPRTLSTVSSEAPTEQYLPDATVLDIRSEAEVEEDQIPTPTQSMMDIHEARVRRASIHRTKYIATTITRDNTSGPEAFDPRPLVKPSLETPEKIYTFNTSDVTSPPKISTSSPANSTKRGLPSSSSPSHSSRLALITTNANTNANGPCSVLNPGERLSPGRPSLASTSASRKSSSTSTSSGRPRTVEYTIPESPTLPPSADTGAGVSVGERSQPLVQVQRAKTTGRKWYSAKYGNSMI